MPPKAGLYAHAWLTRQGVEVVADQLVVEWPERCRQQACGGTVRTKSGLEMTADLVYDCTSSGPILTAANMPLLQSVKSAASHLSGDGAAAGPAKGGRAGGNKLPVEPTLQVGM